MSVMSQVSYDVDSGYVPNNSSDKSYEPYSEKLLTIGLYDNPTFDQMQSELGPFLIIRNYPASYERIFHDNSWVQESFKPNIYDDIKLKAFNLWLRCVDYQFSTGERKIQQRNGLVYKFIKKDSVFTLNTNKRN